MKEILESKLVQQYSRRALQALRRYGENPIYRQIVQDMDRKHELLTASIWNRSCPRTTNLIEGYNSHLEQRLAAIKGFESYKTANLWLNAYVVKRRTTEFTDCKGRFTKLNGECPLFQTIQDYGPITKLKQNFGVEYYGT